MNNQSPKKAFGPTINRVADVMAHVDRYAFHGMKRLAEDAQLDPSTVSRVISGKRNPCFATVARLASAIERQLGYKIDPRELISEDGKFPTLYVCDLMGCTGCLPDNVYDEFGDRKAAFADVKPGQWITSRYPKGYHQGKEVR